MHYSLFKKGHLVFVAICLTFLMGFSLQVQAQDGIGIVPTNQDPEKPLTKAWLLLKIEAGKSAETKVTVQNNNATDTEVEIHSKDAVQTKEGSFTFKENEETDTEVGSWITLSSKTVKVPAKSAVELPVTINVPAGTAAGEYAGVIAVQEAPKGDATGVQLVTRIGARVYITVPGNTGSLNNKVTVSDLELITPESDIYADFWKKNGSTSNYQDMFLRLNLTNTGNVYTKVAGTATISGPDGTVEKQVNVDMAPKQEASEQIIPLGTTWKEGEYKVNFKFNSSPLIPYTKDESVKSQDENYPITYVYKMTGQVLGQMEKDRQAVPKAVLPEVSANAQKLEIKEPTANSDNTMLFILAGVGAVALLLLVGFGGYYLASRSKKVN